MRLATPLFLALWACTPVGIQTDTKLDAGGDADVDADSDTDTDSDTDPFTNTTELPTCPEQPDPVGPWDAHPITVAGAGWTRDPYPFDAGVGALRAATTGNTYPTAVNLLVSGAIVTSRDYVPAVPTENTATFWFEDAGGSMQAYRIEVGFDPNLLQPGDEVAFTATEVEDYFGTLEVTAATGFTVLSTGNDVHIVDGMAGGALSYATNGMDTVEVWGQLVSGPVDCSANCWELNYGGSIVTFRSGSSFDYLGDCIHFIGPLGTFSGAEQLNAGDFDWYFYF